MKAILFAGALALVGTLLGTRWAIASCIPQGYGQLIRDDGPTSHHTKRGTPTMGGMVIIVAVVVAYFGAKLLTASTPSVSAILLLGLLVGLGAVGFLDDFIKIVQAAQPRAAEQGEVRRPDAWSRVVVRMALPAVPRRPRTAPGVVGHLVHPASSPGRCRPSSW